MSDTNRYITHRRPPVAVRPAPLGAGVLITAPTRVDALRKLVAEGRYQVSPRWLANRIFRAAGLTIVD
jgi:hypothetical protein